MSTRDTVKQNLQQRIFAPVDNASLVFFRVAFGLLMFEQVTEFFYSGRLHRQFIETQFHFQYYGFEWVKPLPGNGMYYYFGVMAVLALFITVGLFYRAALALFCIMFAYQFLIDQTRYLNHFYFTILLSFVMIFIPANRALSLDARLWPRLSGNTAPAWSLWLLQAQIAMPYVFGGIHKTNPDWLRGQPIRTWLVVRAEDFPTLGAFFDQPWTGTFFVYGGMLFDLFIVPAMLWKRTRIPAFGVAFIFHLTNSQVFHIGVFPWLMLVATTMYFSPDWPRRLFAKLRRKRFRPEIPANENSRPASRTAKEKAILAFVVTYVVLQSLIPLRPYVYPGNILWTEDGMWFSWNMMLRNKTGYLVFHLEDPDTGLKWEAYPVEYITGYQNTKVIRKADLILQLAHHIAEKYRREGYPNVEIYAECMVELNYREIQPFIDPTVNLAAQVHSLAKKSYIVPLKQKDAPRRAPGLAKMNSL